MIKRKQIRGNFKIEVKKREDGRRKIKIVKKK